MTSAVTDVVLLHGFLGDRNEWDEVSELLSPLCVHRIDLPGHGDAQDECVIDPPDGVRWLAQRIDALGLGAYRLVGYSMGGRLALMFAHASEISGPTGLQSVIVESSHPGLTDSEARSARWEIDDRWAARFETESVHAVLDDWYRQPVFADCDGAEHARLVGRRSGVNGAAVARTLRALSVSRQPALWGWLEQPRVPIGFLAGQEDARYRDIAETLESRGAAVYTETLPGGHNLHRHDPSTYVAALRRAWHAIEAPA